MNYEIYFDESNKIDQPNGEYSYYGALGTTQTIISEIINEIQNINGKLKTSSEMHFVDYTSDTHFEKYFRVLNNVLCRDISINLMIVNKENAKCIAKKMNVTLTELRELFYVKIPERLFYGMTRKLSEKQKVEIYIDRDSHYEKIELERKLAEQMNAHSAYRNKGYKVVKVEQVSSDKTIPLQMIDIFLGIVVFLLEKQYKQNLSEKNSITQKVKSDLIYRILIQNNNLNKFHKIFSIYKWEGEDDQIKKVNLSDYTGEFLIYKTQFDIQEMKRLAQLKMKYPQKDTKFYREEMGYTTRQLKTIQGYLAELKGEGRNTYFDE